MEENTVNSCLRVLKRKTKTRTIRIAFETPTMIKQSQYEEWTVRLFLKTFHFVPIYTVKSVRIIFVTLFKFLQIMSITPCELAFNTLKTHGLHVHTPMLILCCFYNRVEK